MNASKIQNAPTDRITLVVDNHDSRNRNHPRNFSIFSMLRYTGYVQSTERYRLLPELFDCEVNNKQNLSLNPASLFPFYPLSVDQQTYIA